MKIFLLFFFFFKFTVTQFLRTGTLQENATDHRALDKGRMCFFGPTFSSVLTFTNDMETLLETHMFVACSFLRVLFSYFTLIQVSTYVKTSLI